MPDRREKNTNSFADAFGSGGVRPFLGFGDVPDVPDGTDQLTPFFDFRNFVGRSTRQDQGFGGSNPETALRETLARIFGDRLPGLARGVSQAIARLDRGGALPATERARLFRDQAQTFNIARQDVGQTLAQAGLQGTSIGQTLANQLRVAQAGQRADLVGELAAQRQTRQLQDLSTILGGLLINPAQGQGATGIAAEQLQFQKDQAPSDFEKFLGTALGGVSGFLSGGLSSILD